MPIEGFFEGRVANTEALRACLFHGSKFESFENVPP